MLIRCLLSKESLPWNLIAQLSSRIIAFHPEGLIPYTAYMLQLSILSQEIWARQQCQENILKSLLLLANSVNFIFTFPLIRVYPWLAGFSGGPARPNTGFKCHFSCLEACFLFSFPVVDGLVLGDWCSFFLSYYMSDLCYFPSHLVSVEAHTFLLAYPNCHQERL